MSSPRYKGIPHLIYGTAFAFEKTTDLALAALTAGFRAVDTAGSTHAYREALVGDALATATSSGLVARGDLWVQTKFSPFRPGKDPQNYPYDVDADIKERVAQSIAASLKNLQTTYLDSLIMHAQCPTLEETLSTYAAMEDYVPDTVACLGVSNFDLETLRTVYNAAKVKPAIVQNRFTADTVANPTPGFPADLPYGVDPMKETVNGIQRIKEYRGKSEEARRTWNEGVKALQAIVDTDER
ncbi:Maturation and nuclear export of 40S ribosomal subunits interacting protein [Paraconiothyrium brasiliense]|uniref:Maturation and nuclear export of 40S ribosomal subunits interacting protein n=1 Tax=Paraconiothyrium brasiliense TaxID=300254 RepID=A0ABR3QIT5_9PLEO